MSTALSAPASRTMRMPSAVADGRATKLIIPSEIQGMAGLAASLKEIVADDKQ